MLWERFRHLLGETFLNFRRGGWGVIASIGAIAIAFLVTGIFLLLTLNLSTVVARWAEDFQVVVFLDDTITKKQRTLVQKRLDGEMAVRDVTYLSKKEALADFRRKIRGQESLLEGLKTNPLPASFQLRIREQYQTADVLGHLAASLKRIEGVEDVLYGQEWVERLTSLIEVMKILGIVIGGVLAVASLFIVANTIRMAVYARAQEIEIMRLVGATRAYIQIPLILEGTLQGGLGAALALGLLYALFRGTLWQLGTTASMIFAGTELTQFLEAEYRMAMVGLGALLGGVGSLVAVRRFLKV
ncbi:MAG: permease-like cell division protein FtsX [candidate division NC10 bacterium]|nr:permease-like cell division protein FtsX [candidate division NC10 bacterium]